jgi:hypothetical protein
LTKLTHDEEYTLDEFPQRTLSTAAPKHKTRTMFRRHHQEGNHRLEHEFSWR